MPLFGLLSGSELTELETAARPLRFANGESLFSQDEPSDAIYKIVSGVAKLDRLLPDGRRQVRGFVLPGYFLGISMFSHRNSGAQAIGSVTAVRFELAEFKRAVLDSPSLLRQLYELAQRELDAAHELTSTLGQKNAEERVLWFLAHFRDQWERVYGASERIPLPMTRTDIADHLGLTIETVSRTMTKLARDNVIAVEQGAVRVIDQRRFTSIDGPSSKRFSAATEAFSTY